MHCAIAHRFTPFTMMRPYRDPNTPIKTQILNRYPPLLDSLINIKPRESLILDSVNIQNSVRSREADVLWSGTPRCALCGALGGAERQSGMTLPRQAELLTQIHQISA